MHPINRRQLGWNLGRALGAAALASAGLGARAQTGTPRILVGFPAGGSVDATARRLAETWRPRLGTVVVEQKVGAGGRIAVTTLKDAAPDGLTMLLSPRRCSPSTRMCSSVCSTSRPRMRSPCRP